MKIIKNLLKGKLWDFSTWTVFHIILGQTDECGQQFVAYGPVLSVNTASVINVNGLLCNLLGQLS